MSVNNESRGRLVECAKKEFLEKGYEKASLRSICAEARLTTGAVYFLFKDKAGLFAAVVQKPLEELTALMAQHIAEEQNEDPAAYVHIAGDHDWFAAEIVGLLYKYYDEMMLLLYKSQGSGYENVPDRIIDLLDAGYLKTAERIAAAVPGRRVNRYMLHWLTHVQVDAFIHLLSHERDRDKALEHIKPVLDMLVRSFMDYVIEDGN